MMTTKMPTIVPMTPLFMTSSNELVAAYFLPTI
jgi:hypothetical protein